MPTPREVCAAYRVIRPKTIPQVTDAFQRIKFHIPEGPQHAAALAIVDAALARGPITTGAFFDVLNAIEEALPGATSSPSLPTAPTPTAFASPPATPPTTTTITPPPAAPALTPMQTLWKFRGLAGKDRAAFFRSNLRTLQAALQETDGADKARLAMEINWETNNAKS